MINGFFYLESILDGEKTFNSLKEMFAHPSNELYLCSALHELSKFNSDIKVLNMNNFKSILGTTLRWVGYYLGAAAIFAPLLIVACIVY